MDPFLPLSFSMICCVFAHNTSNTKNLKFNGGQKKDTTGLPAVQYKTEQYNTVQYSTIQYTTVQYSTAQYTAVQYGTLHYNTIQ